MTMTWKKLLLDNKWILEKDDMTQFEIAAKLDAIKTITEKLGKISKINKPGNRNWNSEENMELKTLYEKTEKQLEKLIQETTTIISNKLPLIITEQLIQEHLNPQNTPNQTTNQSNIIEYIKTHGTTYKEAIIDTPTGKEIHRGEIKIGIQPPTIDNPTKQPTITILENNTLTAIYHNYNYIRLNT